VGAWVLWSSGGKQGRFDNQKHSTVGRWDSTTGHLPQTAIRDLGKQQHDIENKLYEDTSNPSLLLFGLIIKLKSSHPEAM